jgi:hypothetical protein
VKEPRENSNSELIKRDGITDSPFEVITQNGVSFGTMGQYRLTEPTTDKRKLKRELEKITWNRIIQVVMILDEMKDKLKEVKPIKEEKPKVKKV